MSSSWEGSRDSRGLASQDAAPRKPCGSRVRALVPGFCCSISAGIRGGRLWYLQVASQAERFHAKGGIVSGDRVSILSFQLLFFPVTDFM